MQFKLDKNFAEGLNSLSLTNDTAPALRLDNPAPVVFPQTPSPRTVGPRVQ